MISTHVLGLFFITSVSSSNPCQEFCLSQLGPSALCSTWCKNNDVCHGLMWTESSIQGLPPRVCIHGRPGCSSAKPVLCRDVERQSSSTTAPEPSFMTTATSPAVSLVGLHTHRADYWGRPRIIVSLSNGQTFSMLFDTGSATTHLAVRTEDHAGYELNKDKVAVLRGASVLRFGCDVRSIPVVCRISETARIDDRSTEFPLEIELTESMDTAAVGAGLLGAGFNSAFSKSVGIFSYIPSITRGSPERGQLLIGKAVDEDLCRSGSSLNFYPIRLDLSKHQWIVSGSVQIGSGASFPVNWALDTGGGPEYDLPSPIYDNFMDQLVTLGSEFRVEQAGTWKERRYIVNCATVRETLPVIFFNLGVDEPATILGTGSVIPHYIGQEVVDGSCPLFVTRNQQSLISAKSHLLPTVILDRLLTVFDHKNRRLGICVSL